MLTNREMLEIAMRQSADDIGCSPEDFLKNEHVIIPYHMGANARAYLKGPNICTLVSYGNNIVAAVTDEVRDIVSEYISRFTFYHCFETPNLYWLNEQLEKKGYKVCFMSEFCLADVNRIPDIKLPYETRILHQEDFKELYLPEWSNALSEDRKNLDVLGVGAYDGGRLIGLSGCSRDCEDMWQIGVDVLPEYRQRSIASALTSMLAKEIIMRDKVPFYGIAWSNIRSVRNGIKSGFIPAWIEMSVKPIRDVDDMNTTESE